MKIKKKYFDNYMNYSNIELELENKNIYKHLSNSCLLFLIIFIIINSIIDSSIILFIADIFIFIIFIYYIDLNIKKIDVIEGLKSYNKKHR